jgi:hypothetical protein
MNPLSLWAIASRTDERELVVDEAEETHRRVHQLTDMLRDEFVEVGEDSGLGIGNFRFVFESLTIRFGGGILGADERNQD